MFHRLRARLRLLRHRGDIDHELDEEMSFHIDRLAEDLMRQGMDPDAARREARLRFGSTERAKARAREEHGLAFFDEAGRNLRFALRGTVRSPLFSITSILTLALCIGLAASVFSVVDAVLWRPLPYPHPGNLALAVVYNPANGKRADMSGVDGAEWERVRDQGPFEHAVYSGTGGVNLTTDQAAAYVQQQRVGAGYFHVLGVPPEMGREFDAADVVPGGPDVAILSHGLWTGTFDADPYILGKTIRLKGEAYTVVGVMPADFRSDAKADVWTPLRASTTGEGGGTNYGALIRFPQGMTLQEADARFASLQPPGIADQAAAKRRFGLIPLSAVLTAGARRPMLILLGAIGLMLLVGCANLAGLQIARSLARQSEIATRQALGGGAGALVRQTVVENFVLGVLGGAAGLAVAYGTLTGLHNLVETRFGIWQDIGMDRLALAVVAGLTVVATLLFGLVPVVRVMNPRAVRVLVSGARGRVGGTSHLLRKLLLVGEVAMVTALLYATGLLVRSYGYLEGLDPGFDAHDVLAVQFSLDDARYAQAEQVRQLFDQTLAGIRRIPGVTAAGVALTLPYEVGLNNGFRFPDESKDAYHITNEVYVTPGFFETLRIPVIQGRAFDEGDEAGRQVVGVVNQAFVSRNLKDRTVLGSVLDVGFGATSEVKIVGVVGDVQQAARWGDSRAPVWRTPTLYLPAAQESGSFFQLVHVWFSPSWVIRADTSRPELTAQVLRVFRQVDPDLPVARVVSLQQVMDQAFATQRFEAGFLVVVAAFALLLAAIGLYGIVAHEVIQRRAEMGLRMALGSSPGRAVWTVGATGVRLTLVGLVVGAAASIAVARIMVHLVYGVTPYDPATLGVLLTLLALLAAVASFLPAARVGRMHPADILREV
jgi:predicted permease